ncbi:MAG: hypothetical protein CGU29_01205 [Candidatus Dactylopiibacterium carminicum]|uniref:DUF4129 domain-containing protein n=1 Tax=Candidatus Dactylopiibacterium carminicum TaxID=857335 RepID=A0A272EYA0_9RHOO|nr:DUF4129 domain-containing protein [Candidatus Dactylopiibacterium carminicum]KAF7600475.1 DUF4129 domain-containing protein [Candidatus Dactylopiibacterium carminicum]PAS95097.1 MAG: hypothetical protein CGU29_01205 [Candidatus Dactylopiibacterium carminicum]PAT00473.1 MAG: hypothetical protein BSR46_02740 [Candidatus Dactylopiibacterium carminicum]
MELERLALALRPRSSWEAIDLGIRFGVANARTLYRGYLSVALPLALLCYGIAALTGIEPWWPALLLWWLKPAFDRVALHLLGHAVFGDQLGPRALWRALPGLWWRGGLLRELTLARLSPYRSTVLAVSLLEGLGGKAARRRRSLILRQVSGTALLQTGLWPLLETLFVLSVFSLSLILLPSELLEQLDWEALWWDEGRQYWFIWLYYLAFQTGSCLLEPLYVAGGFALYLKRRTDLEAWDVELQFRRLARTLPVVLAILLAGFLWQSSPAQAADSQREAVLQQADVRIQQILEDPVFGETITEHKLQKRSRPASTDDQPGRTWLEGLMRWLDLEGLGKALADLIGFFASLGRIIGWLLIAVVVVLLAWLVARTRLPARYARQAAPPAELAGFDIRPESLPDDPAAAALLLAGRGDLRAALGLLFRSSLSRLAHDEGVRFAAGDTEGDCLVRVHRQARAHAPYLARLLGCWQRLAYAHQSVDIGEISQLCEQWREQFSVEVPHGT